MRYFIYLIIFSCLTILSCTNKVQDSQTYIDGQLIYNYNCAKCHSKDGSGLGELYPSLINNPDIINYPGKMICYIKKGVSGKMIINGKEYNQIMPPLENAEESDIAAVLTYISNSFGNSGKVWDEKMVENELTGCN